jgi:hypothetical protein
MMSSRWGMLSCVLIFGCAPTPVSQPEVSAPVQVSTNIDRLPALLNGVGSGEVALYEGLPSDFWEPHEREKELKSKKTIDVLGHAFYESKLSLNEDAEQLTKILSSSFQVYQPQKRCSGFHADYCLEWQSDKTTIQAIVSLECGEIILIDDQMNLKCDLTPEAAEKLNRY